jgi:hypothetical protein
MHERTGHSYFNTWHENVHADSHCLAHSFQHTEHYNVRGYERLFDKSLNTTSSICLASESDVDALYNQMINISNARLQTPLSWRFLKYEASLYEQTLVFRCHCQCNPGPIPLYSRPISNNRDRHKGQGVCQLTRTSMTTTYFADWMQ